MATSPTPEPDPTDPPPQDADHRMLDALLSVASESTDQRNKRIERVMQAVGEQLQDAPPPAVIGRIRPLRWLGPIGLAASILIVMWVVWPGQSVETAHAAMIRVAEKLQAAEHRRYDVTALTVNGKRLYGTVDIAQGDRFLGRFDTTGPLGQMFTFISGSDGEQYWLVLPIGPVRVSDDPIGPFMSALRDNDEPGMNLLTLPRAIATLEEGYNIAYADAQDPETMRIIATRNPDRANANTIIPFLATADVIARHDSGEVVQVTFTLDQQFVVGNRAIESITFTLDPNAETPGPEWYELKTHHAGPPMNN